MRIYPEGPRIRQVLINFAELFQSNLKALAFSFPRVGWKEEVVAMWEHFDVPGVLLEDFTLEIQVGRNSAQVFIPFSALTLVSSSNPFLVFLHFPCMISIFTDYQ